MKNLHVILLGVFIVASSFCLQSQTQPAADTGAILLKIKTDNAVMLERQVALSKVLATLEAEARQMRILAKRG